MVNQSRDQGDQNTKKGDQDKAKTNIIQFNGITDPFRRLIGMVHLLVFHV
jgi:hypothetical protein